MVELAEIDPFFNIDEFDPEMPLARNIAELDWDKARPLLEEFVELSGVE